MSNLTAPTLLEAPRGQTFHRKGVRTTLSLFAGSVLTIFTLPFSYAHCGDVALLADGSANMAGGQPSHETNTKPADISRKAEILNSPEWRRAVFELGHWLDVQDIYAPTQVAEIKSRFNAKVARMSSYEVQYLLDDLREKFRVMDTPEAKDARAWVGQYLSVLSQNKRAEVLKNVPDVIAMSAAELGEEIQRIERQKAQLSRTQAAFDASKQEIVRAQQQSIMATQKAVASANRSGGSYSPYRGGGTSAGKTPFSDVKTGSVHVTAGPFGAYVSF